MIQIFYMLSISSSEDLHTQETPLFDLCTNGQALQPFYLQSITDIVDAIKKRFMLIPHQSIYVGINFGSLQPDVFDTFIDILQQTFVVSIHTIYNHHTNILFTRLIINKYANAKSSYKTQNML